MDSSTNYRNIDYTELKESLDEDLKDGFLTPDSDIYVVRYNEAVKIGDKTFFPIVDYFYDKPVLKTSLFDTTVLEAKKMIYAAIDNEDFASFKEALNVLAGDLGDYTRSRSKRNERPCKVLLSQDNIPMMVYYEEENVKGEITVEKVSDILFEMENSNI